MYQRYYIQLGNLGNWGLGSVFAVTADDDYEAIESALELASEVAPGLLTPSDDSTLAEFPDDYYVGDNGIIGLEEIHMLCSIPVERGAGKFWRASRYIPNNYRFASLLDAVHH